MFHALIHVPSNTAVIKQDNSCGVNDREFEYGARVFTPPNDSTRHVFKTQLMLLEYLYDIEDLEILNEDQWNQLIKEMDYV
jgi:hypothetical protein